MIPDPTNRKASIRNILKVSILCCVLFHDNFGEQVPLLWKQGYNICILFFFCGDTG